MAKTVFDIVIDSAVAANTTDTTLSAIVPAGKTVRLFQFGGFDPVAGDGISSVVALQWGSAPDWKTIRAGGFGVFEFKLDKDLIGDGTKRLRLVRQNKSSSAKAIVAWLYATIL